MSTIDARYMSLCLDLATKGREAVRPNPMVGCVIVKNGTEISRGWHARYGGPHAEAMALQKAGKHARGSTLYVNLEPCNHYGKTPPCTESIIAAGVRRVVVGMRDPNPDVTGLGIERLRSAGIECVVGVLDTECRSVNRLFIVNVSHRRPFVTVKTAQSFDGYITGRTSRGWFTSKQSRIAVHSLRAAHDAVMVGGNTVRKDNPRLTVRETVGDQPWRIVLSGSMRLPSDSYLLCDEHRDRTMILTSSGAVDKRSRFAAQLALDGVGILALPAKEGRISMIQALRVLYDQGVYRLLIEGGSDIFSQAMRSDLVDELHLFQSPVHFGGGLSAFGTAGRKDRLASEFVLHSAAPSGNDIHAIYQRVRG
jgi:diaminohydroxyphosphoribosylaminopyrimidine deaminase / 5-amino-6-(5-phosphoribosylamino)uracil reductase